jgi:hypothetical protein
MKVVCMHVENSNYISEEEKVKQRYELRIRSQIVPLGTTLHNAKVLEETRK